MTVYGDLNHMLKLLGTTPGQDAGFDVKARLEEIAIVVSGIIDDKLKRTFGNPAGDTARTFWGTYSPVLIFEGTAARTVSEVRINGNFVDESFYGGDVLDPSSYTPWPYDGKNSLIYGLRLNCGDWHGLFSFYPHAPVQVTGTWEDTDIDGEIPDDIHYITDIISVQQFKNESMTAGGNVIAGEEDSYPKNPWNFTIVKDVMSKYSLPTPVVI